MDPEELKDKKGAEEVAAVIPEEVNAGTPASDTPVVPAEEVAAETPPEVAAETPPETAAETPPEEVVAEPTASDNFRNRIKSAYPDDEFADDEAYFQKASEQLDNLEQYRNNNMEANKALMEIFNAEPAIAELLKDMIEGASFREALARHFSPDELVPAEGDPDREGWKKNAEARSKMLADNELANKKKAENDEFTAKEIADFAKDNKIDPDKAEEVLGRIGEILDEAYSGRISRNLLNVIYKGFNSEEDIKNAAEAARIAGRNEKIVAEKDKKPKGDGQPILGSTGKTETPVKKRSWMDNLVDNEKKKQIL